MASIMGDVLSFLDTIGLFDVLLPFLMIYVMIFAILERTLIFGKEEVVKSDGSKISVPRKNLNAIFSFAVAFFAIMSSKVVGTIHRMIGPIMIIMLVLILFIIILSIFNNEEGKIHKFDSKWISFFSVILIIAIIFIFLNSVQDSSGETWLEISWDYITNNTNTGFVGAIALLLVMAGFIYWISHEPGKKPNQDTEEDEDE
ncbi:MAG: hypothetical protein ACQER9_01910 [Nanobdellota archaeon]